MKKLIVITGPTAVGKTELCINLAHSLGTSIISADSRQIYKELKIGTAVPSAQQLEMVKHYFIGTQSVFDYYNASMYEEAVLNLLSTLFQQKDCVILTGGSTLYVNSVCFGIDDLPTVDSELRKSLIARLENEGIESLRFDLKRLDPKYYETADIQNPKRILKALEVSLMTGQPYSNFLTHTRKKRDFELVLIGLNRPRVELFERINLRVEQMISEGLEQEAREWYPHRTLNSLNTVGYKELFDYFDGKCTFAQAIEQIKTNTRRYAKRQITWFNKYENLRWFHPEEMDNIIHYLKT